MADNQVRYTLSLNDLLTSKLSQASSEAQHLDSNMGSLQGTINRVGAAFGIAFGIQQVKNFAMSVVDAGSSVENAQTGLTTLLKDANGAKEVIKNTMQDAKATPFAFEGLLSANKALISANASAGEARRTVLDLSNAIAATGGGDTELQRMVVNLQQIRNTGKATALDIKQFAYAGINVYQLLADATHLPITQVKDLEVSYDLLRGALAKAHAEGGLYANGLENMANNTSVQISNLGDSLFQLKVRMFDDLKPAIVSLLETGNSAIQWLSNAWEWTKRNRDMIFGLAKGILIGVAAFKAYKLAIQASILWTKIQYASITLLGDGFLTANVATKLFAGGLQMMKTALLSNPFGIALLAIGALTTAYYAFSGAAKDAKRENDKLNLSLYETVKIASEKTENVIFEIQSRYQHGVKGFDKKGQAIKYGVKEQAELMKRDIYKEIDMINSSVDPKKGLDWAQLMQIKKLQGYQDILKRGRKNGDVTPEKIDLSSTRIDKKETHKVTGNRSISIKIDIGNLINELTIKTTTITESTKKITELVTQALLSAVNDSQIVAGQ